MAEMFTSPSGPPILSERDADEAEASGCGEKYKEFATAKFKERNKHLDTPLSETLLPVSVVSLHTSSE